MRSCVAWIICLLQWCTSDSDAFERTYSFAFSNDGFPTNYVENGVLIGHSVELVHAVCKYADKKCETVLVQRKQCWDSTSGFPPFSKVLNARYFSSCASFQQSPERTMTYGFPGESYFRSPFPTLITSTKSKITLNDLKECNDLTLAFPENTVLEPDCLLDAGLFVRERNYKPIRTTEDFKLTSIMNAVTEQVVEHKADLGIVLTRFTRTDEVRILAELRCSGQVAEGVSNMMRKDDEDFLNWWDKAVHKFMCSSKYEEFCSDLRNSDKYRGADPLCRIPGEDLDCKKYQGPGTKNKTEDAAKRINPCISEVCRKRNDLIYKNYRDEVYELRDDFDNNPQRALEGSGESYAGPKKKDVTMTIVSSNGDLFRPDKLCVTVKNVRGLKFVFRGGARDLEESNVLIDFRKEWTTHCERNEVFRKSIRIEFIITTKFITEKNRKDEKIRIRDMILEACTSRAFITN